MGIPTHEGNSVTRRLTLCADDFAQSPPITSAIIELIALGRLTATSVLSLSPYWPTSAADLQRYRDRIDVGLHFSLTDTFDERGRPLLYWLLLSQLHLVPLTKVNNSFIAQLEQFIEQWGTLPDYIDGHQHVHALPGVRAVLTKTIDRYWPRHQRPYIRTPDRLAHAGDSRVKASILKMCCRGFTRHIAADGYATHRWFGGVYSLTDTVPYRTLMQQWLTSCADGSLIMCHPAQPRNDPTDPIHSARVHEHHYLCSDTFLQDLDQADVRLVRGLSTATAPT